MAKVLIVDDIEANRELLAALVRHRGHETVEAADGLAALALVRAMRPDLIFSDILMPTMDGFEFVRQLRADPAIATTEVIFYTAHYRGREAQKLARACGVTYVLTKPCEPAEILRTLDAALSHSPPAVATQPPSEFNEAHLRLMTNKLAEQVQDLLATNQRLTALTEAMLHMASQSDPEELLRGVCREARNLLVARHAMLCVRNKNAEGRMLCVTSGMEPGLERSLRPTRVDEGPLGAVFTSRRAWRAAGDPLPGLPAQYPPWRAILVAPVASLTTSYGWLAVMDKVGPTEFSAEDERVLVGLAAQLGRVYENGSLYRRLAARADELRETELRFRQLAENIHEVFYLVDARSAEVLYVSPAYESVWGVSREDYANNPRSRLETVVPEDRARVRFSGDGYDQRYRIRRPDGEIRWIHDRGFPIRNEAGEIYRIAGIAEDVSVRMHMERELTESGNRLRHAQQLAQLAHVVTDSYGGFVSWSEELPGMIGATQGTMPRSTRLWVELLHPEDREAFRASAIASAITGTPAQMEYRLRRRDGAWIHLRQSAEPIQDGSPLGLTSWFSTIQDVSAQKRAEEERRASDRRFTEMMANIHLLSIMLDTEGRITYCNDYMLDLTGWTRTEVMGRSWFEVFAPPGLARPEELVREILKDQPATWHLELDIATRAGEVRTVHWNNSVLRSASGEVIGNASIGEDITERRRAEEEVRKLNADLELRVAERTAELEAANRELEAYDYSISHDLNSPLTRIVGFSTALLEDHRSQLDEAGQDHLQRITRAADRMSQMISDILRLSAWSRVEIKREPVDVTALTLRILDALQAADPTRHVQWAVEPGIVVNADAGLVRVAIENLVGNAWKFTGKHEGARIEVASEERDGVRVIRVRDNGPGFDPKEAAHLFKPFKRLASSGTFAGTGVGLATVQRIVRRHGGRLSAEGKPGEGATFSFTLGE